MSHNYLMSEFEKELSTNVESYTYSLKKFGLKLDGSDETKKFIQAIDSGEALHIPTGGILGLADTIELPEDRPVYIEGPGYGLATVKVVSDVVLPALFSKQGSGYVRGSVLSKFTIDGNYKVDRCIDINQWINSEISKIRFVKFNISALRMGNLYTTTINTVKDNWVSVLAGDYPDASIRPDYGFEFGTNGGDNSILNNRIASVKVACIRGIGGPNIYEGNHLWGYPEPIASIKTTTAGDGGTQQIETMTVEDGSQISRTVTVTLDGVDFSVPITHSNDDIAATATQIRNANYPGWTTGGTDTTVTFTSDTVGAKISPVFNDPKNYRPLYGIYNTTGSFSRILGNYFDSNHLACIHTKGFTTIIGNQFLFNNKNPHGIPVELEDDQPYFTHTGNIYINLDADLQEKAVNILDTGTFGAFHVNFGNTPERYRNVIGTHLKIRQTNTTAGNITFEIDALANKQALMRFQKLGSNRWEFGKDGVTESGSNAGSDFTIGRYGDNGQKIDEPLKIKRSTGAVTVNGTWQSPFYLGTYALWVDATGDLRIKNGTPVSDTDGTVVGSQT